MIAAIVVLVTRGLVFAVFLVAAFVALAHWAVSNRRITAFHPLARLGRQLGTPFVKPLERRLLRSGGNPSSAPYLFFWVALLGGLALIGVVQWLIGLAYELLGSASAGPTGLLRSGVNLLFSALMLALFIRVVASWFGASEYSRPMRIVYGMTDWLLDPLRKVIPPLGMIDITPFVAYLMLMLARGVVVGMLR